MLLLNKEKQRSLSRTQRNVIILRYKTAWQNARIFNFISHFQSTANFPDAEQKLRDEMAYASEVGEMRSRLAAETAERAQLITALLPAAQDASNHDL